MGLNLIPRRRQGVSGRRWMKEACWNLGPRRRRGLVIEGELRMVKTKQVSPWEERRRFVRWDLIDMSRWVLIECCTRARPILQML